MARWEVFVIGMTRRSALRSIGLGAFSCACCGSAFASTKEEKLPPWSYTGQNGPEAWGDLQPKFQACSTGMEQSPINLTGPIRTEFSPPQIYWKDTKGEVVNNGHTIVVNVPSGSTITLDGRVYEMLQFHFHHPSEHLLDGRAEEMEAHFVHRSAEGDLAVVGVFIREGRENVALKPVWDVMPQSEEAASGVAPISPAALLPIERTMFRYAGSLTTPPCTEIVSWIAYRTPIEASATQIAAFTKLFPVSSRPIQPLNRRFLLMGG